MITKNDQLSIIRLVAGIIKPDLDRLKKDLERKIDHLPTKEEFFTRMDKLSKEIQDVRTELAAHAISHDRLDEQDEDLGKRLHVVEKRLGIGQPSVS